MSKKNIRLSIPKPCNENWDRMTPNERGMHCAVCSREVIDFTTYSDVDLYRFFSTYRGSVCGKLSDNQLSRNVHILPQPQSKLYRLVIACGLSLMFSQLPEAYAGARNYVEASVEFVVEPDNAESPDEKITEGTKCTLKGILRDKNDNLLDHATIELLQGNNRIAITTTDTNGNYSIEEIPAGKYTIVAKLGGFETIRMDNYYIPARKEQHLNLRLEPTSMGEIILIRKRPIVDPENPSKSVIDADDIKNIPH